MSSTAANFVVKNGLVVGTTLIAAANGAIYANGLFYQGGQSITDVANSAFTKANGAVQTGFTSISANGNSITTSSNNDTLTITASSSNGINVLNPASQTIDLGLRYSGVTAGDYGSSTAIPVIHVDAFGRVTNASNSSISTTVNLLGSDSSTGSVSGGGTLYFDSNNGVVTTVNASTIKISTPQDIQTTASPSFKDLTLTGNLSVGGTYTYSNTLVFQSVDSLIELAANNTGDAVDIGFYGQYGGSNYAGLVRTAGSNFVLFKGMGAPTSNTFSTINVGNYGTLRANITGGTVSSLASAINVGDGGTGATTFSTGQILVGNGTGALTTLANTGTAGSYGSASYIPVITTDAYGRVSNVSNTAVAIDTSQITTGTLPIARGGTNNTSYTTGALLQYNGSGIVSIANTGVTAGDYGSSSQIPVLNIDAYGRVTSASNTSIQIGTVGTSGTGTIANSITLLGTYGVTVTASGNTLNIATPQDLQTSASPTFHGVALNTTGNVTSITYTTGNLSQNTVDSFSTSVFRSAKYLAQMTSGSNYHMIELNVISDGTNPYIAEYGEITTGSSLGSFDVSITTGTLYLLFTPTNAVTTVKLVRTAITV
jgi:hypothetical protein